MGCSPLSPPPPSKSDPDVRCKFATRTAYTPKYTTNLNVHGDNGQMIFDFSGVEPVVVVVVVGGLFEMYGDLLFARECVPHSVSRFRVLDDIIVYGLDGPANTLRHVNTVTDTLIRL